MAISTIDRVKRVLGISLSDTTQDDLLQQLLDGATAAAQTYCKRQFEEATRTEFYSGSGAARLILRHYPVQSVSDVRVDLQGYFGTRSGSFGSDTALVFGVDYALEMDTSGQSKTAFLRRIAGPGSTVSAWPVLGLAPSYGVATGGTLSEGRGGPIWVSIPGSVRVTMVTGYPAISMPEDLKSAIDGLTCLMYQTQKTGGAPVASESLGAFSYSFGLQLLTGMAPVGTPRQILNSYREVIL